MKTNMSIGEAVTALKLGHCVARANWNGAEQFLFLVPASEFKVNREPLLSLYPKGSNISYGGHVDIKTVDGTIVPWIASQSDLLADDWHIVE